MTAGRDGNQPEAEALRVDRYLELILVARERGAQGVPHDVRLDRELQATADRLSDELVRVHPSFRFEERLARRLADVASAIRLPAAAGGERDWPRRLSGGRIEPADLFDPARPIGEVDDTFAGRARPLLIGGALTSAAISLAGAAFVAWRLSRPIHPMVRAIRAVHARTSRETGLV